MPPAARMTLDQAGGKLLPPPQTTVFVTGQLWAVLGCPVAGHGPTPHSSAVMSKASTTVFVGGIPACRATDVASCGCPAAPGELTVEVGG